MQDRNINIDVDLGDVDESWGTIWGMYGQIPNTISHDHKNFINKYLDRIVLWTRLALCEGNIGKVLRYKKINTSRYIFDVFAGKNPQFNLKYVWVGKMFSHKEFYSIESKFNQLWFKVLELDLEKIIKDKNEFISK